MNDIELNVQWCAHIMQVWSDLTLLRRILVKELGKLQRAHLQVLSSNAELTLVGPLHRSCDTHNVSNIQESLQVPVAIKSAVEKLVKPCSQHGDMPRQRHCWCFHRHIT